MKTRIIKTSFWRDALVNPMNIDTKLVYLYILTNDRAGLTDYQQIIPQEVSLYTGLKTELIDLCISQLQERGLLIYKDGWVKLLDGAYVNSNYKGRNVEKARADELSRVPDFIKEDQDIQVPNQVPNQVTINNKSKTINHKSEIKNEKISKKFADEETKAIEIMNYWNQVRNTKISSYKGFISNLSYWLEDYTLEDIKLAINSVQHDSFWKDKMTLDMLFRRRNPNGEPVDYIGKFKDLKPRSDKFHGDSTRLKATEDNLSLYEKLDREMRL